MSTAFSPLQLGLRYLGYYLKAANGKGHGTHSPFVFNFILDVLNNRPGYVPPPAIEELRRSLLADQTLLPVEDHGAGSRAGAARNRSVKKLASVAVKPPKWGQLLYRLVRRYQPGTILELGTSLGVTTSYLAAGHPGAQVITVEGSPAIAARASENFRSLGLTNIQAVTGTFDAVLPDLLQQFPSVDLAYLDGNHRLEPTLKYFGQLLPAVHNDSIFVFDDIHWSRGMETAWNTIRQHPQVGCTIDLFFLGMVFFRKEFREKQHFTIRF
ncbi:MAG TPA: class I SAM-dependent methyltransferase [Chitinophagaceae bacterium]|jgi:predicted O-methyltransferase YrrM|nr:class I SAM-dependent methyltransferase [Chitinophagaceae bacterium]